MKRLSIMLVSFVLLGFWADAQGLLQTRWQVNSFGSIEQSTQSLLIKHFTINCYGIFDTTPQIYSELYDMTEADGGEKVRDNIAQVKQIKPSFKALVYRNMRSVTSDSTEWTTFVDNGWLLRDSSGNIILADVGYLVDVGNSDYQNWVGSYLNTRINSLGYDGVFADNAVFWGTDLFWSCSATPINPRTNQPWTNAQARQALIGLHTAIKNAIGSKLLCCNGIFSGYRFYDHQSEYQQILSASPMDGLMTEGMWHPYSGSTPCIWMSEQFWAEAVQFLVWIQNNWLSARSNRFFVPFCKLAYGSQEPTSLPAGATREQMATYAYASTLLGAKTGQAAQIYFSTSATGVTFDSKMQSLYTAQIGIPTGNYYTIAGTHVYTRDFTEGKVLVNPTGSSYNVNLGSTRFVNAATGQLVPQTIKIPPHTGCVLTVETGPSPTPSRAPSISLWTEKTTYVRGQTLNVYIQASNPASAQPVKLNIWFGLPGGGKYAYGTYYTGTIPAAYTSPVYTLQSSKIPTSAAAGTYSVNAEIRNPSTNVLIDSDTYYFAIN